MNSPKSAVTAVPIHPLLAGRWSSRAFTSEPLGTEVLTALLEAARWAPSSANEQPWRFVVARREDPWHTAVFEALTPGNRKWAGRAAALIVAATRTTRRRDNSPNRFAWHDAGLATAQLILQANALGWVAHPMAGFDAAKVREVVGLPAEVEPVTVIAVGRRAAPETLEGDLREREEAPRSRLPLEAIAFSGRYEQPFAPGAEEKPSSAVAEAESNARGEVPPRR